MGEVLRKFFRFHGYDEKLSQCYFGNYEQAPKSQRMPTNRHGWCPTQTCGLLRKQLKKVFKKLDLKQSVKLFFLREIKHFFIIPIFKIRLLYSVCVKTKKQQPHFFQNLKAYTQIFLGR